MTRKTSNDNEFPGFHEARFIMVGYEIRSRVLERFELTDFIEDMAVAAVHVNNTERVDRDFLTAFDLAGHQLRGDTLYTDEPSQHLDIAPEFDHEFTGMSVAADSELEAAIARECGWVINMQALRAYDAFADRRATQRAVFLAHLADLIIRGEARGLGYGPEDFDADGAA